MIQLRRRHAVESSANTDFVREMKAALAKKLAATSQAGKRAAQAEMNAIMRRYLVRSRRRLVGPVGSADVCTDGKLAAAGRD